MITTVAILLILLLLYFKWTKNFNYWKKKGVVYAHPYPIVGSIADIYFLKRSPSQLSEKLYYEYSKEKVIGMYRSSQPTLIVKDPKILKRIFETDFSFFYRRGLSGHNDEPMLQNLFFADGDLWRLLRQRLTHVFSSAKLRAMYPLIEEVASRLQTKAAKLSLSGSTVRVYDLMARYTTDLIGSCGFGINADSLNNDDCAFRLLGKKILQFGFREVIIMLLKDNFPQAFKHLKYFPFVERELIRLVKEIQANRNYEPSGRNDFIDVMLECRKKGTITCESIEHVQPNGEPILKSLEITDEVIAAQAFIFFGAGFETSSSVTSTTLHHLAYHPEYQRKVQKQIDEVLAKYDDKICYEAVKEMTYLECALKESVRMLTPVGFLTRECVKTYTIPEIDVTIDEGVLILIPLQALYRDPKYFPEPDEFKPDRFLPSETNVIDKYTFLLFGAGPRMCIGERLGQIQSLAGLVAVLSRCTVSPAPSSRRHPVLKPVPNIVQGVIGGFPLLFNKRESIE